MNYAQYQRRLPFAPNEPEKPWSWDFIGSVSQCHKWYRCRDTGRIAVCDYSGKEPHQTDDGVLWLVPDQEIFMFEDAPWYGYSGHERPAIRIVNENGIELFLGGTLRSEAQWLVDQKLARWL